MKNQKDLNGLKIAVICANGKEEKLIAREAIAKGTDGARTDKYIWGGEELTLNSKGESVISYADYTGQTERRTL